MAHVSADDFRVPGEKRAFWVGTALLGLLLLPFLPVWPVIAIVIGAGIIGLWIMQGLQVGNGVKVSEKQLPHIHSLAKTAAARLSMKMPDVFVAESPVFNACAIGFLGRKTIQLNSALVKGMTPDELAFIIGHEFAHIKCNHTNLLVLTQATSVVSGIPFVSPILGLLYKFWSRKGEYTCDRGGLLACRNEAAAVAALAKMAVGPELFKQMDLDEFLSQHMDLEQDDLARLSEAVHTHPYVVKRIRAVAAFHDSDQYRRLAAAVA